MSDYNNVLQGKDAISSKMAKAFVTIKDKRIHAINFIQFEAKINKNKVDVPRLGSYGMAKKSVGWDGEFSGKIHYVSSDFVLLLEEYKNTGEDVYFEIQVTNSDPTSDAGEQTIIYENCNLNGGTLSKFDAEGDLLTEDVEGTFDNFHVVKAFNALPGMA